MVVSRGWLYLRSAEKNRSREGSSGVVHREAPVGCLFLSIFSMGSGQNHDKAACDCRRGWEYSLPTYPAPGGEGRHEGAESSVCYTTPTQVASPGSETIPKRTRGNGPGMEGESQVRKKALWLVDIPPLVCLGYQGPFPDSTNHPKDETGP